MAAVTAELRFRDGRREKISVIVQNNLSSLNSGIQQLNADVSKILSELVEREKLGGARTEGEENDSDEEDEEPEEERVRPPVKRCKTSKT